MKNLFFNTNDLIRFFGLLSLCLISFLSAGLHSFLHFRVIDLGKYCYYGMKSSESKGESNLSFILHSL